MEAVKKSYSIYESTNGYSILLGKKNFDKSSKKLFLSMKNGNKYYHPTVFYSTKDCRNSSDAEARFLRELTDGITLNRFGSKIGTVSLRKDGKYSFTPESKKKEPVITTPQNIVPVSKPLSIGDDTRLYKTPAVIADPTSESARNLIGKNVEISRSYSFSDCKRIRLTNVELNSTLPFYGYALDDGKQISGVFIREYKVIREPLDLDDGSVRASLRGKWIINKANGQETMITSFRKVDGHYQCNGLDARSLMTSWEFDNGGLIGVEK